MLLTLLLVKPGNVTEDGISEAVKILLNSYGRAVRSRRQLVADKLLPFDLQHLPLAFHVECLQGYIRVI